MREPLAAHVPSPRLASEPTAKGRGMERRWGSLLDMAAVLVWGLVPQLTLSCIGCDREFKSRFAQYREGCLQVNTSWVGDQLYCRRYIDSWVAGTGSWSILIRYFPKALQRIDRHQQEQIEEAVKTAGLICKTSCEHITVPYVDCSTCGYTDVSCGGDCKAVFSLVSDSARDLAKSEVSSVHILEAVILGMSIPLVLVGVLILFFFCRESSKRGYYEEIEEEEQGSSEETKKLLADENNEKNEETTEE
nr:PREDICTED: izumo sperm-egg fusion protein 4 isoform X2 [Latimeria chalumnae]|eukprot:XP_014351436.1 PREDICTED: izumo sperm-egg fusion protein 4 isoform X2 [Latimeria chalumnae]